MTSCCCKIALITGIALGALSIATCAMRAEREEPARVKSNNDGREVQLMTLDPGHFHAALIQKETYPNVSNKVHVYSPLGFDLSEHLNRIARFNLRPASPTDWALEVHTGNDSLERMLRERPGNVVVLSGRNRGKIDKIKASVDAGLNVLADKPWIVEYADLPKLESALATADGRKLIAYDIMTERHEITTVLQKELIHDAEIFGEIVKGDEKEPAVFMDSVHHILKLVAGAPNIRPAWFFDASEQGEGLSDVATHLVDLIQWMLFPEVALDHRKDIEVMSAKRWPTVLNLDQFKRVTNLTTFPDSLRPVGERIEVMANGLVSYRLRGILAKINVVWNYEAPQGGDTHLAVFRGSKSNIEVRQGINEKFRPEVYVVPRDAGARTAIRAALDRRIGSLAAKYPGVGIEDRNSEFVLTIPDKYRTGHEAHFGEVTSNFLEYLKDRGKLPAWEGPNMLAKYYTTTKAVELSRKTQ